MKFIKTHDQLINTDFIKKAFVSDAIKNQLVIIWNDDSTEYFTFEGPEAAQAMLKQILIQGNQAPVKFEDRKKPGKPHEKRRD